MFPSWYINKIKTHLDWTSDKRKMKVFKDENPHSKTVPNLNSYDFVFELMNNDIWMKNIHINSIYHPQASSVWKCPPINRSYWSSSVTDVSLFACLHESLAAMLIDSFTSLVGLSCLFVFLSGCQAVPLNYFLPFGADNGDMKLPSGWTVHATVELPVWFVYYKQQYKQLHVSRLLIVFIMLQYSLDLFNQLLFCLW